MRNKKKSPEQLAKEKRKNPARSDFKVYQFGRDDGRRKLEFQRLEGIGKKAERDARRKRGEKKRLLREQKKKKQKKEEDI